ncbi:AbrB/MazE/SpoVT family DNA-binding domain-containing protein [Rugamonas sp. FT107W]|uniref:AbrB/MazE/SpoVT family DNA-binding domain-containing protein n=1 Tax=Duganella vulcania TaxID=2692166 RepID=A0A845HBS5_9BURK|nr:AbrB/MazE/SpoVT family DNA-binding domain-containing protein [Duganella vulcania]MYN16201.1 AbrB/MazE/SpoVT family DNA-binding domain-containing protein [Duganella vulcania]
MCEKVQLSMAGGLQMVRLPRDCQFEGSEVYVHRDPASGDVILSSKPPLSWAEFFAEDASKVVPADFMNAADRRQGVQERDPFAGVDV